MMYKFFLSTGHVNRQTILRCGRHFNDITKSSYKKFHALSQTRTHLNTAISKQLQTKCFNDLKWIKNFCTKPPAKKTGSNWLSIRRQHNESKHEIRRLFTLARKEKWYLICAIGCLVISTTVTIGVPHAIGKIMDMIVNVGFPRQEMLSFCVGLFAIFIAGSLANFGRIYLMNSASKFQPHLPNSYWLAINRNKQI